MNWKTECNVVLIGTLHKLRLLAVDKDDNKDDPESTQLRHQIHVSVMSMIAKMVYRWEISLKMRRLSDLKSNWVEAMAMRTAMQWANLSRGTGKKKTNKKHKALPLLRLMKRLFAEQLDNVLRNILGNWRYSRINDVMIAEDVARRKEMIAEEEGAQKK